MSDLGESKKKTRSSVDVGRLWYAVIVWGCALLVLVLGFQNAHSQTLRTNKKVPAVGGYSTTRKSETSTVGILTQVEGKIFAKKIAAKKKALKTLHLGSGLDQEHEFWLQEKSRIFAVDLNGNRIVATGPAVFSFTKQGVFKALKGSFFVETAKNSAFAIENSFLNGLIKGQASFWTTSTDAQLLTVEGQAKLWHQKLPEQKVQVNPGYFTEASLKNHYLQPERPMPVDAAKAKHFVSQFGVENVHIPLPEYFRELASEGKKHQAHFQGSRTRADVVSAPGAEVMKIFNAKLRGKDTGLDDAEDAESSDQAALADLIPVAGSRGLASGAKPNRKEKPSFEIVVDNAPKPSHQNDETEEEKETLLRKLRKKSFTDEL